MNTVFATIFSTLAQMTQYITGKLERWAEYRWCDICNTFGPPERLVDTGHNGWYACTTCWEVIQSVTEEVDE